MWKQVVTAFVGVVVMTARPSHQKAAPLPSAKFGDGTFDKPFNLPVYLNQGAILDCTGQTKVAPADLLAGAPKLCNQALSSATDVCASNAVVIDPKYGSGAAAASKLTLTSVAARTLADQNKALSLWGSCASDSAAAFVVFTFVPLSAPVLDTLACAPTDTSSATAPCLIALYNGEAGTVTCPAGTVVPVPATWTTKATGNVCKGRLTAGSPGANPTCGTTQTWNDIQNNIDLGATGNVYTITAPATNTAAGVADVWCKGDDVNANIFASLSFIIGTRPTAIPSVGVTYCSTVGPCKPTELVPLNGYVLINCTGMVTKKAPVDLLAAAPKFCTTDASSGTCAADAPFSDLGTVTVDPAGNYLFFKYEKQPTADKHIYGLCELDAGNQMAFDITLIGSSTVTTTATPPGPVTTTTAKSESSRALASVFLVFTSTLVALVAHLAY